MRDFDELIKLEVKAVNYMYQQIMDKINPTE